MPLFKEALDIHRMDLVSWTFGNENYNHDRKIYVDADHPGRSITASEARCTVRKLVSGFKSKGLQPGDCVCVHAFNDIMYTMLVLGILGAGGRFTGSNPAYTPTELSHHMRITRTRFLISEPELIPRIAPAIDECGLSVLDVFVFDSTNRDFSFCYRSWKDLLDHGESDWVTFKHENEAKKTTAALLSTSGTSGLPKAAMISHYSFVMQNIMLNDSEHKFYEVSRIISLPEFHAFAFPITHIAPLREGIRTYVMRRFDIHRYLSAIQQYEITETPMVPQMLRTIMKHAQLARNLMQSLRLVWSAGSPLSEIVQTHFYRLLKSNARVVQVWGMTEAGWISTFLFPEKDHTGSVGRLLAGMEAKLVHNEGHEVSGDDISAEVLVRGPTVMQGYLGNTSANTDAFDQDGWLRTGDIAYQIGGKFYIVDRKKEMIKVRGWQVSPAELETSLLVHADISDAAVVGIRLRPGDDSEVPRAYVVKAPNCDLSEHEVKLFMSSRAARYKNLDGGVVFVDRLPRSSAGKILRGNLRERAAAENCTINEKPEKNPSAPPAPDTLDAKPPSASGTISLDSCATSYDGVNETRNGSRRSSTSTAGTVHSEATGRTSRSALTTVSTNDDFKYHDTRMKEISPTLFPPEDGAQDLRSQIEHVFAERVRRMSDAQAKRRMANPLESEIAESRSSDGSAYSPISTCKSSSLPDLPIPGSEHLAVPDLKKRAAEKIRESKTKSKKLKMNDDIGRSTSHRR